MGGSLSPSDSKTVITARPALVNRALLLLVGVCLFGSGGCTAERIGYWTESVQAFPDAKCKVSDGELICNLAGGITLAIANPSADPVVSPAGLVLEIPVGHVVRLSSDLVEIALPDGSSGWIGRIVSTGGFRYKKPQSLERESDAYGDPATRELVGSTFMASRASENLYGLYKFEIQTKEPYPERFELQLPSVIVDEKTLVIPSVTFQYGKHTKVKGYFGV